MRRLLTLALVSVVWLVSLAQPACGEIAASETANGVVLENGRIRLTLGRDGMVSAAIMRDGKAIPVLSKGRAAIVLAGGSRTELVAEGHAPVREMRNGLGSGKLVRFISSSKMGMVEMEYGLYEGSDFFTAELFVTPVVDARIVQTCVIGGSLDLGGGEVRVLTHDKMWEATVGVLAGKKQSQFFTGMCNRTSGGAAVIGSLTAMAETVIQVEQTDVRVQFEAMTQYGGPGAGEWRIDAGKTARTGAYAIVLPGGVFEGLESYGAAVRQYNGITPYRPIPAGWCSWDAYGNGVAEKDIVNTMEVVGKLRLKEFGFNVVQIDDGWQRGWRCSGDWRYAPERFPRGIKPLADMARSAGLTLGLWIGPFSDEDTWNRKDWPKDKRKDPIDFPELTIHNDKGEPTGLYDLSNPQFAGHLTETIRRMTEDWGAGYIKADFLAWGYGVQADKRLPHHDIFRNALRAMREGMPPSTYFMTCISHEWKSLGIADSQRIGNDVGQDWKGLEPTLRCAGPVYFTNGNFWWNDPDQLHISGSVGKDGKPHGVTLEQARAWATLVALYGGVVLTGDRLTDLAPERVKLLTQCIPSSGRPARPMDLFDVLTNKSPERHSSVWALKVEKPFGAYHVVGLFNWTGAEAQRRVNLKELGYQATDRLAVYDFWQEKLVDVPHGSLGLQLPVAATSCRLLVVHRLTRQPMFVSSDRHLTGGLIDVVACEYDPGRKVLAGKSSMLVAGVAFRYTFYVPEGMKVTTAIFDDRPAEVRSDGNVAHVTFTPSASEIAWRIEFSEAK